jgi:hypothetical protein
VLLGAGAYQLAIGVTVKGQKSSVFDWVAWSASKGESRPQAQKAGMIGPGSGRYAVPCWQELAPTPFVLYDE